MNPSPIAFQNRLIRCVSWIAVWISMVVCPARGQRFNFKSYTQDQGLTNMAIRCLLQDHSGFIWVGTKNGLFWYDGKVFHEFGAADHLQSKEIEALYETSD